MDHQMLNGYTVPAIPLLSSPKSGVRTPLRWTYLYVVASVGLIRHVNVLLSVIMRGFDNLLQQKMNRTGRQDERN
ncbi:hypothetical protein GN244_ATG12055 [Phytophthora infestans]|uniref:Transmembrane protein n=1 Tax=Phytophthora infestans TaxID=4787 RepID=A0A833SKC1_PHYIN|nr:hypothetical protein GN244_ATG12055 [Phytophthora infestans]KAF4135024.1 hypothetical protein GN958_ATG15785 [Phytophthora infestans]